MNFPYHLLPNAWLWGGLVGYVLAFAWAAYKAPWRWLLRSEHSHVYFGTTVILLLLWSMHAGTMEGLEYHYLGATLMTLMFGWPLAIVGMSIVLLGLVLNGTSDWQAFPLNVLVMGVLPVFVSQFFYFLVDRRLPNHFMTYIFIGAFLGAGVAIGIALSVAAGILILSGVYSLARLGREFFPYVPLMIFPEAIITGMLLTVMVGLRPTWVSTFDDERYLKGK